MRSEFENIDSLSASLVPVNSRVLDLGCGDGKIGQILKQKGCNVTGVELNYELAKIAKWRLSKVIVGDLENTRIQNKIVKEQKFDIIFASAILEHLKNPDKVLKSLYNCLNKDGFVIITLPNIAYWRIRVDLLMGRFNYVDSGILDKTHLKFFTIKSAIDFVKNDCSLKIFKIDYEFPPIPIIHRIFKIMPSFIGKKIQSLLHQRFAGLFAYQMLFLTKPNARDKL